MTRASGSRPPDRHLVLVRHGATLWNEEGRFTTRTDVELSPAGREQAAAAGKGLAGTAIDRVVCSPLRRALATGEAIAAAAPRPPPVAIDERLREIDAGPFEGLTGAEIEAGPMVEEFHRWRSETDPVWPDGAETYESAVARARSFFADVRDLPGTTLAATHGSLARVLVAAVVLRLEPALHRRMWLDHCHCAVVALDESPPRLVALNVDARDIGV
jgi:broad specificity phosphatase PhoE